MFITTFISDNKAKANNTYSVKIVPNMPHRLRIYQQFHLTAPQKVQNEPQLPLLAHSFSLKTSHF